MRERHVASDVSHFYSCVVSSHIQVDRKPRNARSKRVLEGREPKEVEDERTAIFVRGTRMGKVVQHAMKELVRLSLRSLPLVCVLQQ